jgi:transposase InsO family protein
VAYTETHPDETGASAAGFLDRAAAWFAARGVAINRVITDNAKTYTASGAFAETLARHGAAHKTTRAYGPQTNGKVERFNRTLAEEWAYNRVYSHNLERQRALPSYLHTYNHHRPHAAFGGATPVQRLDQPVHGNHS